MVSMRTWTAPSSRASARATVVFPVAGNPAMMTGQAHDRGPRPPEAARGKGKTPRRIRVVSAFRDTRRVPSVTGVSDAGRTHDRGPRSDQTVRLHGRRRVAEFRRTAGNRYRFPRSERLRQVHHDAHDPGSRRARRRAGTDPTAAPPPALAGPPLHPG